MRAAAWSLGAVCATIAVTACVAAAAESERIQPFEGVVLRKQGSGIMEGFTVRKISFGIGVERTFPVNSPRIDKIEVVANGQVRRARLFYLRELQGKAARLKSSEESAAQ